MITLRRRLIRFLYLFRPLFPQILVNYLWHLPLAYLASRLYGNPSRGLEIIGVTGTDGKTTTALLIYHLLKSSRRRVAVVSTVEARIGRTKIDTGFHVTNPDPFALQKLLRRIRSQKYRYVVLEATSHGLDQFRIFPMAPQIAVLTNITHEHLDYHRTMANYRRAKLKLFTRAKHAVLNKDLPYFGELNRALPGVHFSTYSLDTNSQLQASHVKYLQNRTKFTLGRLEYVVPLTGKYNLYNTLAAVSTALLLGIPPSEIRRFLPTFPGVPGRLEPIENGQGINALVDFAHTPNALQEVLTNLRSHLAGPAKLIVVFGHAGLRDSSKRPLMGAVAAALADRVILTAEDPRGEDVTSICRQILSGAPAGSRAKFEIVPDRTLALERAVQLASRGDTLVICGKGHERSMNISGDDELPWSDQKTLSDALSMR